MGLKICVVCSALGSKLCMQQQHNSQMLPLHERYAMLLQSHVRRSMWAALMCLYACCLHTACSRAMCLVHLYCTKHAHATALLARVSIGETWIGIEYFRRPGLSCRRVPQLRDSNLMVRATLVPDTLVNPSNQKITKVLQSSCEGTPLTLCVRGSVCGDVVA